MFQICSKLIQPCNHTNAGRSFKCITYYNYIGLWICKIHLFSSHSQLLNFQLDANVLQQKQ
jgi:hypothetical protein